MSTFNQPHQQIKTRTALVIFIKSTATPLILYVENTEETYNEIQTIIKNSTNSAPKLIEKIGKGPLKKICILDTQIAGVAIQEEPFIQ